MQDGSSERLVTIHPLEETLCNCTDPALLREINCSKSWPGLIFTTQLSKVTVARPIGWSGIFKFGQPLGLMRMRWKWPWLLILVLHCFWAIFPSCPFEANPHLWWSLVSINAEEWFQSIIEIFGAHLQWLMSRSITWTGNHHFNCWP